MKLKQCVSRLQSLISRQLSLMKMTKNYNDYRLNTYEEDSHLIILSTHHIDEIEAMCEKIAIINQQTIVRYENTEQLKMHGVFLSGSVKAIEPLVEGHTILEKRKL